MDDLRLDKVDHAIVGGVNVIQNPEFTNRMARGGFLGDGQRCRTFDAEADGYVRAEGAVVMVLSKRDCLQTSCDNDESFYCQLLGGASNHNGHSPLITVPSARAQAEVVRAACSDAGIPVEKLDYLECHGTGTRIGDPIEIDGLVQACGAGVGREKPLYLGSAKSNVGHLESAAGIVGLLRAVLSLQNQQVYGNPLLKKLNPGMKIPSWMIPVKTLTAAKLEACGVSSFGFGGSNAHVVVGSPGSKKGTHIAVAGPSDGETLMVQKKAPQKKTLSQKRIVQESGGQLPRLIKMVKDMGFSAEPDLPLLEIASIPWH
jgi:acyl transferase domain-containing protein